MRFYQRDDVNDKNFNIMSLNRNHENKKVKIIRYFTKQNEYFELSLNPDM